MTTLFRSLILAAATFASGLAHAEAPPAADANAGGANNVERKAAVCAACHGPGGLSTQPAFPTLAGQHKDYLIHSLKEYKSGKRKNAVMAGQATGLSDSDIVELATYFSKQKGPLYVPALD